MAALDLYLKEPTGLGPADVADAFTIAEKVGAALTAAKLYTAEAQQVDRFSAPPNAHTAPMARRIVVWKAMGLLNVHLQMTAPDALALLRARVYATERVVDDIAHDVLTRRISIADLPL